MLWHTAIAGGPTCATETASAFRSRHSTACDACPRRPPIASRASLLRQMCVRAAWILRGFCVLQHRCDVRVMLHALCLRFSLGQRRAERHRAVAEVRDGDLRALQEDGASAESIGDSGGSALDSTGSAS